MADTGTPHDALVRALLSDRARAGDFLRDHLPTSVTGRFSDDLPEIIEGSFIDETLAGSQSDVLMKVELAGGGKGKAKGKGKGKGKAEKAFVYVLAEHKSAPDPGLPLQLASYMVRIWKRYAGGSAERLRSLPPIIPIVLYHGAAEWKIPASLRDMIDVQSGATVYLPGEGYVLKNLRAMEADALSLNPELRAGSARCGGTPSPRWRTSCPRTATSGAWCLNTCSMCTI